jgi:hypothetical protein
MTDLQGYLRVPGTSIPSVFMAGTYRRGGEKEFWYLKFRTPGVMTIYLKDNTLNYDKIRLTCSPEIAQDIAEWWHERLPA